MWVRVYQSADEAETCVKISALSLMYYHDFLFVWLGENSFSY
jgi:hypothetical protein